jgi:hypothetical protein
VVLGECGVGAGDDRQRVDHGGQVPAWNSHVQLVLLEIALPVAL